MGVVQSVNSKCPLCRRNITAFELRQGITAAEADAEEASKEAGDGLGAGSAGAGGAGASGAAGGEGGEAPAQGGVLASESKLQALLKEVRLRVFFCLDNGRTPIGLATSEVLSMPARASIT